MGRIFKNLDRAWQANIKILWTGMKKGLCESTTNSTATAAFIWLLHPEVGTLRPTLSDRSWGKGIETKQLAYGHVQTSGRAGIMNPTCLGPEAQALTIILG